VLRLAQYSGRESSRRAFGGAWPRVGT